MWLVPLVDPVMQIIMNKFRKKKEYKRQIICAPQYQTYRYSEFLSQYLVTFKMHFHRFANYNRCPTNMQTVHLSRG